MRQKGIIGIFVLLLVLATVAAAAYFKWIPIDLQNKTKEDIKSNTANWPVFESKVASYSFQYPPDWELIEIPGQAQTGQPDFMAHSPNAQFNEFGGWLDKGMRLDVSVEKGDDLTFPIGFVPEVTMIPSHLKENAIGVHRDPENTNPESYDAFTRIRINGKTINFHCANVTGESKFNPVPCVGFLKQILSTFKFTPQ